MTQINILELLTGLAILLSCACAWLTFWRTGRPAQALQFSRMLREDPDFRKGKHAIANLQQQMKAVETRLADVATKTDVAKLEGDLHVIAATAERTEKTLDRVHEWLMERSAA